jgi:hypothetical protein
MLARLLGTTFFAAMVPLTTWALPPSGTQCAGYGYSRWLTITRDGSSVKAESYIGGFNPCGFWTWVQLKSPSNRTATAEYYPNHGFSAHVATTSASLSVATDSGKYTTTNQWQVEDDTSNPFQYYTPNPQVNNFTACSAGGDQRESIIPEYFQYLVA